MPFETGQLDRTLEGVVVRLRAGRPFGDLPPACKQPGLQVFQQRLRPGFWEPASSLGIALPALRPAPQLVGIAPVGQGDAGDRGRKRRSGIA